MFGRLSKPKQIEIPEKLNELFEKHKEELDVLSNMSIRYYSVDISSFDNDSKDSDEKLAKSIIESSEVSETFQELLFKFIDSKNLNEVEVYKKAYIDRRLFSRIKSNKNYHPSFGTITLLALSMKLSTEEFEELLKSASYSLPTNMHSRLILRYCFDNKIYDINTVNNLIFSVTRKEIKFL